MTVVRRGTIRLLPWKSGGLGSDSLEDDELHVSKVFKFPSF